MEKIIAVLSLLTLTSVLARPDSQIAKLEVSGSTVLSSDFKMKATMPTGWQNVQSSENRTTFMDASSKSSLAISVVPAMGTDFAKALEEIAKVAKDQGVELFDIKRGKQKFGKYEAATLTSSKKISTGVLRTEQSGVIRDGKMLLFTCTNLVEQFEDTIKKCHGVLNTLILNQ